jgi:Zn-dependent protease with chaperone function
VSALPWAAGALAAGIALALAAARPRAARAEPRLAASAGILTLAGIAVMPPLLVACVAAALGSASAGPGGHVAAGVCVLAGGPIGPGQLAVYGLAAALAARTAVLAAAALRAARRAELRGLALAGATPRQLPGAGTAWIIPSRQLAAHCAGLRRPRAVVSTGLLDLLAPAEQEAVLRHELAHIRLGHPRILLLGAVTAQSYRWLPPARLAWTRLRRDLEAAADDEAAAAAGTAPLLSALAKVALAAAPSPAAGSAAPAAFADPDDLRYRVRRLQQPHAPGAGATLILRLAGALLTVTLASSACQALHASAQWSALVPCLAAFGYLGLRPTWSGGRRRSPGPAR